ncbi:hypothetical protein FNV43_RR21497 [Rhamnella rubrinervis]|uniref:Uncharacterized protein n=1 Tax=Rhamnella rubrinervis TaxID=2594499 RepID=A0A8K0GVE6_9ROSA|nr:hypothetical protein FNV43_RR21497 [Rhamnella rubrinervis]
MWRQLSSLHKVSGNVEAVKLPVESKWDDSSWNVGGRALLLAGCQARPAGWCCAAPALWRPGAAPRRWRAARGQALAGASAPPCWRWHQRPAGAGAAPGAGLGWRLAGGSAAPSGWVLAPALLAGAATLGFKCFILIVSMTLESVSALEGMSDSSSDDREVYEYGDDNAEYSDNTSDGEPHRCLIVRMVPQNIREDTQGIEGFAITDIRSSIKTTDRLRRLLLPFGIDPNVTFRVPDRDDDPSRPKAGEAVFHIAFFEYGSSPTSCV